MKGSSTTFTLVVRSKQIAQLTDVLSRCEALRGIGWSISVFSHLADDEAASALRKRVSGSGDVLIPEGYVDAPHGLLTTAELELNIEWAYTNPWKTGISDRLGSDERVLAPLAPDLDREAALELYRSSVNILLLPGRSHDGALAHRLSRAFRLPVLGSPAGEVRRPAGSVTTMIVDTAERTGEVAVLVPDLCAAGDRTPRGFAGLLRRAARRYRAAAGRLPIVLLLDVSAEPACVRSAAALLQGLNTMITEDRRFELAAVSALPGLVSARTGGERLGGPLFSGTAGIIERAVPGEAAHRAGAARAGRGTAERKVRATLEELARPPAPGETGEDAGTHHSPAQQADAAFPRQRDLVANMMGSAMLPGGRTSVTFTEGRPAGIACGSAALEFPRPVEMQVRIAGRPIPYRSESAFSFEGTAGREEVRGLVSHFRVDGDGLALPGAVVLHSSITDRSLPLVVDLFRTGPVFTPRAEGIELHPFVITPFEIASGDRDVFVESEGVYPDGTSRRETRSDTGEAGNPTVSRFVVRGAAFRFTLTAGSDGPKRRLYIGFVDDGLKMIRTCVCWFEPGASGPLFRVSVGGSVASTPAALLSGTEEHMTILLGVDEAADNGAELIEIPRALRSHIALPWYRAPGPGPTAPELRES